MYTMLCMRKIDPFKVMGFLSAKVETAFWKLWWVCLVILTCLVGLEQALKSLHHDYKQLHQQQSLLIQKREEALAIRENLKLQINSQSDPAWVELTLKKGLGLVPEGHTKVLFIN